MEIKKEIERIGGIDKIKNESEGKNLTIGMVGTLRP